MNNPTVTTQNAYFFTFSFTGFFGKAYLSLSDNGKVS